MARAITSIIADIEVFKPTNGNWLGLDALLEELFQSESASRGIDALFRVIERYPNEDGAGVFWGIVHGLESLPGYEARLVESVRKAPSNFALLMVGRLLNAGKDESDGVRFDSLLKGVIQDQNVHPETRRKARQLLDKPQK